MINVIKQYTKGEKEYISNNANFTPNEYTLFNLRSEDLTLEECAEIMNVSVRTCSRLNKCINNKIKKLTR